MKKISAIGFDWGGVILQNIDGSFADAASAFLEIDNERFRRAYFLHNHMINIGVNSKAIDQATDMWSNILSELGMVEKLDAFMTFFQSRPKGEINQEIVDLLYRLKSLGWKLGLLSNMSAGGVARIRSEKFLEVFDVTFFSCEVDLMKPQPEVFFMFANALHVPIEELVFIDDSTHSLSTADDVGYMPILFQTNKQLVADLALLGVEI